MDASVDLLNVMTATWPSCLFASFFLLLFGDFANRKWEAEAEQKEQKEQERLMRIATN